MSYDLHTHSTHSDGSCTPEELIAMAQKAGLKGLSITDHDSASAYPEALILGKKQGIHILPGIEFSCDLDGQSVHILGYSFDFLNPGLLALCTRHQERRAKRNSEMLKKLESYGFFISEEELKKSTSGVIGRPHIAKLLMEKGYVSDIREAFQLYIGDGKKCYVQGHSFLIDETLDVIRKAGGFAVLAHPHLYKSREFVHKIMSHSFDGIEAEYSQMPPKKNAIWITYAKKHHLLMTGGSDFHGSIKPFLSLGATQISSKLAEPLFTRFYSHYPEYRP